MPLGQGLDRLIAAAYLDGVVGGPAHLVGRSGGGPWPGELAAAVVPHDAGRYLAGMTSAAGRTYPYCPSKPGSRTTSPRRTLPIASAPKEPVELSEGEQADLAALAHFRTEEAGYAIEHGTKPQTGLRLD